MYKQIHMYSVHVDTEEYKLYMYIIINIRIQGGICYDQLTHH